MQMGVIDTRFYESIKQSTVLGNSALGSNTSTILPTTQQADWNMFSPIDENGRSKPVQPIGNKDNDEKIVPL